MGLIYFSTFVSTFTGFLNVFSFFFDFFSSNGREKKWGEREIKKKGAPPRAVPCPVLPVSVSVSLILCLQPGLRYLGRFRGRGRKKEQRGRTYL